MIHWIINPGLIIGDLILGLRVPKLIVEDKESNRSRWESTYIPCPHCDKLHDSRTWSKQNGTGFKNWFGLYCPNCKGIIPCLRNAFSLLIIIVTFPLWYFIKDRLKNNWLKKQPTRFENLTLHKVTNPYEGKGWLIQGLGWGFIMFIEELISGESIESKDILIGIGIWTIGGLWFGRIMNIIYLDENKSNAAP